MVGLNIVCIIPPLTLASNINRKKMPVYFNFHGGGFVLGYYEQDGLICQKIAREANCIVININYLLAPEHKFPVPIVSSAEAIDKILQQDKYLDSTRIILGGFSAGGSLAVSTVLYILANSKFKFSICGVVTDYALFDFSINEEKRKIKYKNKAISPARLIQYKKWYFNNKKELYSPLASPIYADLSKFPVSLIMSAEYDSLCEEEYLFAKKLKTQNKLYKYVCYKNCTHGYTHKIFNYNKVASKQTIKEIKDFLIYRFKKQNIN